MAQKQNLIPTERVELIRSIMGGSPIPTPVSRPIPDPAPIRPQPQAESTGLLGMGILPEKEELSSMGRRILNRLGLLDAATDIRDFLDTKRPARTEFVQNLLSSRYSPQVVAGIMGNIDVETGGTFDPTQKQGSGGVGRGLFQMGGKMLRAYNKYLTDNGLKNTAKSQIDFMSEILSSPDIYDIGDGHRKAIKKAFKSGDVDTITKEFSERVLRPGIPHLDRRLESARRFVK